MASSATLNILSLCAGVGGFDLGFAAALNLCSLGARVICHVEREASAAAILAARMAEGSLDAAPVWSDLRTFDGRPWRGVVDCLTAGYPCQPFSCAGLRLGEEDPRHLWPEVDRVIGETQPPLVFLENVAAHLRMGFATVRRTLESRGYRVQAGLFSAAEVGASHRRERLFILAYLPSKRSQRRRVPVRQPQPGQTEAYVNRAGSGLAHTLRTRVTRNNGRGVLEDGGTLAHANSHGQRASGKCNGGSLDPAPFCDGLADAAGPRLSGQPGERGDDAEWWPSSGRGGISLFAPGPSFTGWPDILAKCPEFAPAVEPGLRVLADGVAVALDTARANQLRAAGNGVFPLCAAHAFITLARRSGLLA